jgi:two-component system, NtrC family, sensor kinase
MDPSVSTGRALARAGLVSVLFAGLIPSALCLVRKTEAVGRADVLVAPEGDGLRVHRVGPSASASGLVPGDLLLVVDGASAREALEPAKLFADRAADVVLLRGGAVRRLRTTPAPAPWDLRYLFLFAVGGAFLASALATLRPPVPSREALLFAAFAISVGLVLTLTPAPPFDGFYRVSVLAEDAARALFPAFLLALVLTFPRRARRVRAWLPFVPAAALLAATARVYFGPIADAPSAVAALDRAQITWMAAGAALAAARLVLVSRRPTDLLTEKQVRFLLLGTAVGLLPLVVLNLVPRLLGGSIPILSTLALLPLALVPAAFLAALTRYRLWDVEVLGREAASVTGALLVGAGFFTLAEVLLANPLAVAVPHARGALQTSAGLLMALSFVPVRRGLSAAFLRLQYRDGVHDRNGLLALLRELPSPRPLGELTDLLVARVTRGLGVPRAALLGVAGDAADGGPVDGGGVLPLAELPAAARLRATRLSRQDFAERPTPAVARLRRAGFRTLAPLTVSGRLLALFAVADRAGRVPLSTDDAELLETVLAPAALALDHARLFDELKTQADRYRSLQEFHENVVAGSAAAIAATDGDGRFTSVNPAFAALLGRSAASLLGARAADVLPPALSSPHPPARVEADLGSGARVLNVAVSPFPGAPEGSNARVLVLVDATETARLERALADRERLTALGTLSAGVAHEVNTPLAGVAGFARLLLDETAGDDPRRPLVEKIERQAFRASRLVGSLLDLARGRPREIAPLDPGDVAREALRALEDEGAARGAAVRLALPGRVPAVAGHRDALVQVLVNLVKNGIESVTAPGPARPAAPEVVLAVSACGGSVRFDVTDNGPGLAPEDASRVFDPFFSTKTAQGGTGLGLSMARDIIRAHGGTLTATSGAPGARFTVTLPAAT